jgi:hypothetical protein
MYTYVTNYIVTYWSIAKQRLGKHIPSEAYAKKEDVGC